MDANKKTALKTTGAVGAVGLLFGVFLKLLFQQQIIELLGSDRVFYIVISLLAILSLALILAIQKKEVPKSELSNDIAKVIYKDKSKHIGNNKF